MEKPDYDGIHLRGPAASRHFTYRAVNAIKSVFGNIKTSFSHRPKSPQFRRNQQLSVDTNYRWEENKNGGSNNYHDNCPQAQYQWRRRKKRVSQNGEVTTEWRS